MKSEMTRYYKVTDNDIYVGYVSEEYVMQKFDERVLTGKAICNLLVGEDEAVDVEPMKHGHWEEKKVEYDDKAEMIQEWQSAKCSVCGRYDTRPHLYYPIWSSYCPNCGADMRGGEE